MRKLASDDCVIRPRAITHCSSAASQNHALHFLPVRCPLWTETARGIDTRVSLTSQLADPIARVGTSPSSTDLRTRTSRCARPIETPGPMKLHETLRRPWRTTNNQGERLHGHTLGLPQDEELRRKGKGQLCTDDRSLRSDIGTEA